MRLPTVRRRPNRKLRQRRRLRALFPSRAAIGAAFGRAVRRAAPALAALAGAGLVAAVLWGGWRWLTTSSRFALRAVVVEGTTHLSGAAVLRRTGVRPGTNVFRVPLDRVERALADDPWIAEVTVRRRLPDRLAVLVEERRAAAVVMVQGEGEASLYLAGPDGRPFKRASIERGEADGLVAVSGVPRALWRERPDVAAALVRRALSVATAWRASPDRPAIGEVHVHRDGLNVYTHEGAIAVALGRAVDDGSLASTMTRFDAVWAALTPEERAAARTIHLESKTRPDRVAVRLADATGAR